MLPVVYAFELWCWRRLLRVPWTARISNKLILQGINPECPLEGLMLKLKFQCFGSLATWCKEPSYWKRPWCWRDWRQEEKGTTKMRWLDGNTDSMDVSLSELREMVKDREAWRAVIHGVAKNRTRLSDWTELNNDFNDFKVNDLQSWKPRWQACAKDFTHFITNLHHNFTGGH